MPAPPRRPAVYGHRGASAHAPENTIEAIELAFAQGAEGVEIDVRGTADGVLVLSHDPVHPAVGVLASVRFSTLRRLAPEIPTLAEALAAIPAGGEVDVEIKNEPGEEDFDPLRRLVPPTLATIRDAGVLDRVVVSSFDPVTMDLVRRADETVATAQLLEPGIDPVRVAPWVVRAGHDALALPVPALAGDGRRVVEELHRLGLGVVVWTVDDPELVRAVADYGVEVIITNDPAGAIAALEA